MCMHIYKNMASITFTSLLLILLPLRCKCEHRLAMHMHGKSTSQMGIATARSSIKLNASAHSQHSGPKACTHLNPLEPT